MNKLIPHCVYYDGTLHSVKKVSFLPSPLFRFVFYCFALELLFVSRSNEREPGGNNGSELKLYHFHEASLSAASLCLASRDSG